jgi:hypothetical protein
VLTSRINNFQKCQINTPHEIISGYWKLLKNFRPRLDSVLDLGAGDGRFAIGGYYKQYDGVEIDTLHKHIKSLPPNARMFHKCVFEHDTANYGACIGNPPYVRHHEIENNWRSNIVHMIRTYLSVSLNEQCNLFVYFLCLGIIKTKPDGIIALIVPYEWASRPSVKPLQEYIKKQKWGVHIYKFRDKIFSGVLTTASITIIDKKERTNKWKYYEVDSEFNIKKRKGLSEASSVVLPYEKRGNIWALRGLSPGTQKIFTLTEGERIHFGLSLYDVEPCATSLREIPKLCGSLNKETFKEYLIDRGQKCWLIKSYLPWAQMSDTLQEYIQSIPEDQRNTATCNERTHWYQYIPHPTPNILYSSGFTTFGPKILNNRIGAKAIGSVHGIHSTIRVSKSKLLKYLNSTNFEKDIVAHSNSLKKVEVKQMNGILNKYL